VRGEARHGVEAVGVVLANECADDTIVAREEPRTERAHGARSSLGELDQSAVTQGRVVVHGKAR
jgi:hypothetical protein